MKNIHENNKNDNYSCILIDSFDLTAVRIGSVCRCCNLQTIAVFEPLFLTNIIFESEFVCFLLFKHKR